MKDQDIKDLLAKTGALLEGHFLLSSGLHSDRYMQCALVLAYPEYASRLGSALALLVSGKPDLVLSPAMGGLIIGHEVARALGVRAIFTERENGVMALRRGFELKPGEDVVVVEDVITTGRSSKEVIALARSRGANVIGALAVVSRGETTPELGVPVRALLKAKIDSYEPALCPLCLKGLPVVKPGSRSALKT